MILSINCFKSIVYYAINYFLYVSTGYIKLLTEILTHCIGSYVLIQTGLSRRDRTTKEKNEERQEIQDASL